MLYTFQTLVTLYTPPLLFAGRLQATSLGELLVLEELRIHLRGGKTSGQRSAAGWIDPSAFRRAIREKRDETRRTPFVDGLPTRFGFLMPIACNVNSVSLSRRGFGGFGPGSCGVCFVRRSCHLPRRVAVSPTMFDDKHFISPFSLPSIASLALDAPSRVSNVVPRRPRAHRPGPRIHAFAARLTYRCGGSCTIGCARCGW